MAQWQPSNNSLEDFLRQQQEYDLYELKRDGSIDDGRAGISTDPLKYPITPPPGPYGYGPSGRGMIRVPLRQATTPGAQLQRALVGNNTDFPGYVAAPEETYLGVGPRATEYSGSRTYDMTSNADWVAQQKALQHNQAARNAGMTPEEAAAQNRSIAPPSYNRMDQIPRGESGYLRDPLNGLPRLYQNNNFVPTMRDSAGNVPDGTNIDMIPHNIPVGREGTVSYNTKVSDGGGDYSLIPSKFAVNTSGERFALDQRGLLPTDRPKPGQNVNDLPDLPKSVPVVFEKLSDSDAARQQQQNQAYADSMAKMRKGQAERLAANPPKMDLSRINAIARNNQRMGMSPEQSMAMAFGYESQATGNQIAPNSVLMGALLGPQIPLGVVQGQALGDVARLNQQAELAKVGLAAREQERQFKEPLAGTPEELQRKQGQRNNELDAALSDPTTPLDNAQVIRGVERGATEGTFPPKIVDELKQFHESDEYDNHRSMWYPGNWLGRGSSDPDTDATIFAEGARAKYGGGSKEAYRQFYFKNIRPRI